MGRCRAGKRKKKRAKAMNSCVLRVRVRSGPSLPAVRIKLNQSIICIDRPLGSAVSRKFLSPLTTRWRPEHSALRNPPSLVPPPPSPTVHLHKLFAIVRYFTNRGRYEVPARYIFSSRANFLICTRCIFFYQGTRILVGYPHCRVERIQ